MSSFSIRDILDLPQDTIRTLQVIKSPMEIPQDNNVEEDSTNELNAKETDDDPQTTNGKYLQSGQNAPNTIVLLSCSRDF